MLSNQAQVAKIIRNHCKQIGIKCRAKSEGYSMGDSVRVTVYDQPPKVFDALNELWAKYQYGHFDGMQDMYEYSTAAMISRKRNICLLTMSLATKHGKRHGI